jgi:hypothetical protein
MARKSFRPLSDDDFGQGFDDVVEPGRARRRRLKARAADRKAQEVDRSATPVGLERAAKRLKAVRAADRVLSVPQWNMDKAVEAMRRAGVSGLVTNLCGSQRVRVEKTKAVVAE